MSIRCRPTALVLLVLLAVPGWLLAPPSTARADEPVEGVGPVEAGWPKEAGWPVVGTVLRRFDPPTEPWDAAHRGVDLSVRVGDPVRAAAAGTVTYAGRLAGRGVVVVDHGGVRTTYEPVDASVAVGRRVAVGQGIGVVHADARAPAHCATTCLHWGLRRGEVYLDPLLLLTGRSTAGGPVRLVAESEVAEAERRARERMAVRVLTQVVGIGPGGEHGFALPAVGPVSSGFGMRHHPVLGVWKLHDGTDVAAPCGSPLHAPADGVVVGAYADAGYGNRLLVDHGTVDGRHVVTALNHASGYAVAVGDQVTRGQVVGRVGRTGYATGCHLHLMVWLDGALVDPLTWFR